MLTPSGCGGPGDERLRTSPRLQPSQASAVSTGLLHLSYLHLCSFSTSLRHPAQQVGDACSGYGLVALVRRVQARRRRSAWRRRRRILPPRYR